MKLHEKKLKEIIKAIEKHATVKKVEILNTAILVKVPKANKVVEIDINMPLDFRIDFTLGELKEDRSDPSNIKRNFKVEEAKDIKPKKKWFKERKKK